MDGLSRLIPDPLVVVDVRGSVVESNRQAKSLLGASSGPGGRPFEYDESFRALLQGASGSGDPVMGAVHVRDEDGALRRFRVRAVVVERSEHGLKFGLQVLDTRDDHFALLSRRVRELNREVAEHRVTQARLRASLDRLRDQAEEFHALADNIPTLCWMAYADGHVYWFNRRWYEYTATRPDTQQGWGWESVHHPDHLPRVLERWRHSLASGEPFEMVFPIRGRDGEFRPFLTRVAPIYDDSGRITRWFGTNTDVSEQERQQKQLTLLINELNHRVKNTLATVQSMAARSFRGAPTLKEAFEAFEGRLMALSAAHNVLTATTWEGADLRELLARALEPFGGADRGRFKIRGDRVWLPQNVALPLALVFHELATNAVKYGALSAPAGRVTIAWATDDRPEGRGVALQWSERGGPAVAPPTRQGFGSQLIQRTIVSELGGAFTAAFHPEGFSCALSFPLATGEPEALEGASRDARQPLPG